MSELGKQSGICKGICKKFKTDLPISGSRYGSGQSYCNLCETWTNHLGCHLKNGNPAQENTVGWYCNCCNYRVRQKPRSKKSKEILKKELERSDQTKGIDNEIYSEEKILAEDLHISKKQAGLLKGITKILPNKGNEFNISKIVDQIPDFIQFEIKDNWGSWENFFELATNYSELNKISSIILFEKLNSQIGRFATEKEFLETVNIDTNWIKKEFKSWGNLLDLLGYDPWYRNNSKKESNIIVSKTVTKKQSSKFNMDNYIENDLFKENDSFEETVQKLEKLKLELLNYYKSKDLENNYVDYSYEEMFQLLEEYLNLLPAVPKYGNIRNFF